MKKDYKKIIKKIDKYIAERKYWSSFDEVEALRADIRKAKNMTEEIQKQLKIRYVMQLILGTGNLAE